MKNIPVLLFGLFLILLICPACSAPDPLSGVSSGESGRVVRVLDGDSLVLDTGLRVRLVGIEAPGFGWDDEPDAPYAQEARRQLEDLTLGRRVQLHYPGLTRDRYDRALAYVETIDDLGEAVWINHRLAATGAVRVRAYPDTAPLTDLLLEAEVQARANGLGLWSLETYMPQPAGRSGSREDGFHLILAELSQTVPVDRVGQVCAFSLVDSNVRLIADPPAATLCTLEPGSDLLVRGYLSGTRLYITHHYNFELL